MTWFELRPCTVRIHVLVRRKYRLLVTKSYTAVLRFVAQPTSGDNLLLVSAAVGQLSATGITDTKQQYGGCNPQEVKVCGGYGPHEVNVLRVPPAAGCKSTAGVTCSKLRLVLVKPAGGTDFLRGALEPHTPRPHPLPRWFAYPQTHVGEPDLWIRTHQRAYMALGMDGQNGCLAINLRGSGPNTRNCATRGRVTPRRPHPLPYPTGWFAYPQTHVGELDLWARTHRRAYMALGLGGQNGCPAVNLSCRYYSSIVLARRRDVDPGSDPQKHV
jgi:hypothetical protein